MVGDPEGLAKIREFFFERIRKLPNTLGGVEYLIADVFWQSVSLALANPKIAASPEHWAYQQISGWASTFFEMHEDEDFEMTHSDTIEDCLDLLKSEARGDLAFLGRAPNEMKRGEARIPLLKILEEAGAELNNPEVRPLIRNGFRRLVSDVSKVRTAVLVKGTCTEDAVQGQFAEFATLTPKEVRLLLRRKEWGQREKGACSKIAAKLAGDRCGLRVGSVLRYARQDGQG